MRVNLWEENSILHRIDEEVRGRAKSGFIVKNIDMSEEEFDQLRAEVMEWGKLPGWIDMVRVDGKVPVAEAPRVQTLS
jgi:hypothetical protein